MSNQDTYTPDAEYWLDQARAAFVAMLEAWEGMNAKAATDHVMLLNSTPALILPITETSTKENNNG